ncbi:MAG: hypothetical protein KF812_03685 [Fimbriimonadaceae bacterium]|nr:hypothetical protein [Fimbriimonadaceae bacterium]
MRRNHGRGMVEVLIVMVIIVVGVIVWSNGGLPGMGGTSKPRADGVGETVVGRSMAAAKDDKCISNLKQVRMAISMQTDPVDEIHPTSLTELKLGSDFEKCPLGGEPYTYDPATGTVKCPHLGHENY